MATQEPLALRAAPPFRDPGREAQHFLPCLTLEDDIETYLKTFERVAHREGWDMEVWPRILNPLLSGEARIAYYALSPEDVADNGEVKKKILAWYGRTSYQAAADFHRWSYQLGAQPRDQMNTLLRLTKWWLHPEQCTITEVAEKVAMDRFLRALLATERRAVGIHVPGTPKELLTALELALEFRVWPGWAATPSPPGRGSPHWPDR